MTRLLIIALSSPACAALGMWIVWRQIRHVFADAPRPPARAEVGAPYRDDLAAAQARIAALETELIDARRTARELERMSHLEIRRQ